MFELWLYWLREKEVAYLQANRKISEKYQRHVSVSKDVVTGKTSEKRSATNYSFLDSI